MMSTVNGKVVFTYEGMIMILQLFVCVCSIFLWVQKRTRVLKIDGGKTV